jgi:tetratricopeptide (TPR) repeat protein
MKKFYKIRNVFSFLFDRLKRTNRIEKLYFKNKWHECIAECNIAIDSGKLDFFYFYYLGLSKFQLNFLEESTEHLRQALAIDSNQKLNDVIKKYRSNAKYQISFNYRKQRNYEKAIDQLDKCIIEEPDYLNYYQLKANIYEDMEKTELAIEAVSKGLAVEPRNNNLLELQKRLTYCYSLEQSKKRNGG